MGSRTDSTIRWSGLLLVLFLSPCLVHGQVGAKATKEAAKATTRVSEKERPPFDLTYVPSDATSVLAIRPNAIFHDPAMKPLACFLNQSPVVQMLLLEYIPFTELKLPIEEIEQVIIFFNSKSKDTWEVGTVMIRAAHDFDWLKQMRHIDPKTKETRHGDQVYYNSHIKVGKEGLLSDITIPPEATFRYLIPDERTLVLVPPSLIRAVEKGEKIQRPHFSWDKEWKHIEHDLVAIAQSNCDARSVIKTENGKEVPEPAEWTALTRNVTTMIAGVDWKDGIDLHAYLTYKEPAAAEQAIKDIKPFRALSRLWLTQDDFLSEVPEPERKCVEFQQQLWKSLIDGVRIARKESTVCVHTKAKMTITEMAKGIMSQLALGESWTPVVPQAGKSE